MERTKTMTDADEGCFNELCRHRNWRSGSMPTHKRGADCPAPTPDAAPNEYVPTTADVRFEYSGESPSAPAAFDRWLAAHDAVVRDAALTEAADKLPTLAGWNAAEAETILLAQKSIRRLQEGTPNEH